MNLLRLKSVLEKFGFVCQCHRCVAESLQLEGQEPDAIIVHRGGIPLVHPLSAQYDVGCTARHPQHQPASPNPPKARHNSDPPSCRAHLAKGPVSRILPLRKSTPLPRPDTPNHHQGSSRHGPNVKAPHAIDSMAAPHTGDPNLQPRTVVPDPSAQR